MRKNRLVAPVVKWVGGKRQLMLELLKNMPETYNRYFEPFIGGGALFFELQPQNGYISDMNEELINLYTVVRDDVYELIDALNKHKVSKEYFLKIRNLDRTEKYNKLSDIEKASRFIYLNRTCFNGLYRVNSKGQFNVPFGKYTNPTICDERTIYADSLLLQKVEVLYGDFEQTEKFAIADNTFIYCDPPYRPLTATANFSAYSVQSFSDADQIRLKKYADRLSLKHCFLMLSNADCREWNPEDNFLDELYREYHINRIQAVRCINANAAKRGKLPELLIRNYQD